METALLILVLAAGDPASKGAADAIGAALHVVRAEARIVISPDANKLLAENGLKDADLLGRSEKALTVTAAKPKLILVRVERRDAGNDRIVAIDQWAGGRHTTATAVAGKDGDPQPAAAESASRLLAEASLDPAEIAARADTALIAGFAEHGDWVGLIASIAQRDKPSPRLRHAAIVARLRLGDSDGAAEELAKLQAEAPQHPLTREAAALIAADPGGADSLRDAPSDDGGNVLK